MNDLERHAVILRYFTEFGSFRTNNYIRVVIDDRPLCDKNIVQRILFHNRKLHTGFELVPK